MAFRGKGASPIAAYRSYLTALICLLGPTSLAACAASEGLNSLLVDPARYSAYRCKDLITESKNLANREKELRNLIDKANDGGAGVVIGALAYRSDYQTVLEQEKLLKHTAEDMDCQLVPTYRSDRTIR